MASARKTGCFPEKDDPHQHPRQSGLGRTPLLDTKSNYFRLTTRVTLGTTEFTLYSLLIAYRRRQGHAAAALIRNSLVHGTNTAPAPPRPRSRRDRMADHRRCQRDRAHPAARIPHVGGGGIAFRQGRGPGAGHSDSAGRADPAARKRRQIGARSALRPGRTTHRGRRSAELCDRPAPQQRHYPRGRGIAHRSAGLAVAAECRRARAASPCTRTFR